MKKHEIISSIIKIPLDFGIVFGSFFLAKKIRLATDMIPGVYLPIQTIDTATLTLFALCGGLLYIFLFSSHKLYSLQISHSKIQEIFDILRYSLYWFLFYSVGVYLGKETLYSGPEIPRLIIVFTAILSVIGSISVRICINIFQNHLLKKGYMQKRHIILIHNKRAQKIHPIIEDIENSHIYKILGYSNNSKIGDSSLSYIGGVKEIEELAAKRKIDEILYIESDFSRKERYEIWEIARIYGIRYRYITNNFDLTKTNTSLSLIHKIPVIEILNTPLNYWNKILKRFFDISFSLFCILLLLPLIICIAIMIKIEDPSGPVIYKNRRIGQNGIIFNCYKFRYIQWKYCIKESYGVKNEHDPAIDYEKSLIEKKNSRSGPLYKIENDPRKTKIGVILEKYSLDEIPQFFNVIYGDMSIVGPRPHQPREVEQYKTSHKRLLTIKPGITGMAQVHGRENNDFEKEAKLDVFYIENWTFLLDLKILFRTLAIIFSRK